MVNHLEAFARLMWQEKISENVIKTFAAYYNLLFKGSSSKISKKQINPPSQANLIEFNNIPVNFNQEILKKVVIIKLNGGLGTSMGLAKAKSLLPVKGNLNFLDIIARQVLTLRAQYVSDTNLIFMNSYNTHDDTIRYLDKYPDLALKDVPLGFLQNKFPRINKKDLSPFLPEDERQKWNPPGHGDIYTAIYNNGLLDNLLSKGVKYAFVSNADNLGATLNPVIPSYMEKQNIPFMIEVCIRNEVDKKGGHLSETKDGKLVLREIAQCPDDELAEFQNIDVYKYFNTNNIWLDLTLLKEEMDKNEGMLILPLIINPKTVNGTEVYQLETAMGAAISIFSGAKALVVHRTRFAPVKKTTDLLGIWSDAYDINDQYQVVLKRSRKEPPVITLDDRFYGSIEHMRERFKGIPSLQNCDSLNVSGNIYFEDDVVCKGNVCIMTDKMSVIKDRLCEGIINL